MGKGYAGRKAPYEETGHIGTHVVPTRQAAAELSHKYIETYQNEKKPPNPFLFPNPHQAITLFNSLGERIQTRMNCQLEEIDDLPSQTKIWRKGRIQIPATSDTFLGQTAPPS